jgi:hypothetical protein
MSYLEVVLMVMLFWIISNFYRGSYFYENLNAPTFEILDLKCSIKYKKDKAVPLHAMEALGGRGGIAPTHSRPRH